MEAPPFAATVECINTVLIENALGAIVVAMETPKVLTRSLRPIRELCSGGEAAGLMFGALVTHLGARYRYFPLFARLEGEALRGALEARAEGLCLQLLDSPTQLAALHAFGWGRLDRWIR
ncbi:MAG: hypothetical protein JRH20_31535, partial [Deltaproteobacteria bacterium]|nr:hypothetical protein [Deltaproteobacteria bacterium]